VLGWFMSMRHTRTLASTLVIGLVAVAEIVLTAWAPRIERPPEGRVLSDQGAPPVAWKRLVHDGCQFAVPVSWRAVPDGEKVVAADGSTFSVRKFRILDWSVHKAHIRETFGHLNIVHEDSDHRFWFETGDENSPMHYIAVRDGLSACIALMQIRATAMITAEDTASRIVASIGSARVR
jgi:hypothetical protein